MVPCDQRALARPMSEMPAAEPPCRGDYQQARHNCLSKQIQRLLRHKSGPSPEIPAYIEEPRHNQDDKGQDRLAERETLGHPYLGSTFGASRTRFGSMRR